MLAAYREARRAAWPLSAGRGRRRRRHGTVRGPRARRSRSAMGHHDGTPANPYGVQGRLRSLSPNQEGDKGETFARESGLQHVHDHGQEHGEDHERGDGHRSSTNSPQGSCSRGAHRTNRWQPGTGWKCKVASWRASSPNARPKNRWPQASPSRRSRCTCTSAPGGQPVHERGDGDEQGGGAVAAKRPAAATEAEGETTVTPAVPFGIASFATSVVESKNRSQPRSARRAATRSPTGPNSCSTTPPAESE